MPLRLTRPMIPIKYPGSIPLRFVASSVSGKPGSQSLGHAAINIKEEVGNSAADLAKVIAANDPKRARDAVDPTGAGSFLGITRQVLSDVPVPMMVLGLAGGIPYVVASATTMYLAHEAGQAAMSVVTNVDPQVALGLLHGALEAQVTYGAVLLSFLGCAMHWGLEIAEYGGQKGYARLGLGTIPMLIAWPTLVMEPISALIVQWLGFTALWLVDAKVTMAGWTPSWYSQYRFYLSLLVGSCIIGSIACTAYWGPVAGRGVLSHDLDKIREERKKLMPAHSGMIPGPVEAVPADTHAEHFIRIHNKERDSKDEEE